MTVTLVFVTVTRVLVTVATYPIFIFATMPFLCVIFATLSFPAVMFTTMPYVSEPLASVGVNQ